MKLFSFVATVLRLTKPYRFRLILGIVCGFLAGLTNPALMVSVKLVTEVLFPQPDAPSLLNQAQRVAPMFRFLTDQVVPFLKGLDPQASKLGMLLVISTIPFVMLMRGLFTYLNIYLMNWVSIRTVTNLRAKLFDHLLSLSASFFNRTSTGDLMSRFHEVGALQGTISNSLVVIVREPITILSLAAMLLTQQPRLTMIALVIFPLSLIPFVFYARKVRRSSAAIYVQNASLSTLIHETFTGYRIIKAYNLEKNLVEEYQKTARTAISHFMRVLRSAEIPGPLIEFFAALGVAAFFVFIAFFSPVKTTPGDLLLFVGSIFLMYAPIKNIIRLHNQLEQAQAASQYVFDLLKTTSAVAEPAQPVPLRAAHADIHFDDINFDYGEKPILRGIQLTVKAGQMVALVGSTGSGKTTLTNLLLRFYDPQSGAVRIGGLDIRQVSTRDLRSQIAVVTQETVLFNDTIRRNIELGWPGASQAEIEAAAKHAHAHDFILEKAQGYDTIIGERGTALSGGQRQRIAIARAILRNAPILILDEATSSLDTEKERAVQAALEELMQGRTTICVAHRLSTVQNADVIVVMSEGRIVETGRHKELIKRGGHYQKLYDLQFQS